MKQTLKISAQSKNIDTRWDCGSREHLPPWGSWIRDRCCGAGADPSSCWPVYGSGWHRFASGTHARSVRRTMKGRHPRKAREKSLVRITFDSSAARPCKQNPPGSEIPLQSGTGSSHKSVTIIIGLVIWHSSLWCQQTVMIFSSFWQGNSRNFTPETFCFRIDRNTFVYTCETIAFAWKVATRALNFSCTVNAH